MKYALPLLVAGSIVAGGSHAAEPMAGVDADWRQQTPGRKYHITIDTLPKPFATESAANGPHVVPRPKGTLPIAPAGFEVNEFAGGFRNPRYLLTAPNGDILVAESEPGLIRLLRDTNGDGNADQNVVFVKGLKQPFGLAFYPPGPNPEYLYVGNTDGVVRFPYRNGDLETTAKPETITELSMGGRLTGGGHWTRDIVFSNDGKELFASVGSRSNVGEEKDSLEVERDRARILVMRPDGSQKRDYATGIRNPVGLAIQPQTGALWTSVNERDGLGDNLVPDYITRVKEGGFYGWPWFYIGDHPDPRHTGDPHPELAGSVLVPDVLVQSHSASLKLVFYDAAQFPPAYRGNIFAAFHGSWNREQRTGYKVVRIPLEGGEPNGTYEDFLTGFVTPEGQVWGRPVGLTVAKDGSLLVSDDGSNTIWRVSAQK